MVTTTQQILAGYKQTEVGVIPEDWDVKELGNLLNYEQPTQYLVKDTEYSNNFNTPVLTAGKTFILGYSDEETGIFKNVPIIIFDDFTTASRYVSFSFKAKSSAMKMLRSKTEDVNLRFVFEKMQLIDFTPGEHKRHWISEYKKFEVAIPKSNEQTAIANILSDTDELIEKLEKLIAKKKAIKQGAMQELLTGKRRLPGFTEKWEEKELGKLFTLSGTYSKSKFLSSSGKYLVMDMGAVSSIGSIISTKRTYLKEDLLIKGDLVMPKDDIGGGHIIGKVGYINTNHKYVLGDHVYKLSQKTKDINTLFFSYLINSHAVNSKLKKKVAGSAQLGLGKNSVEEEAVKYPLNNEEQTAIANVLSDMDFEIDFLEKELVKYQQIKIGMMQLLLTGKIRIYGSN